MLSQQPSTITQSLIRQYIHVSITVVQLKQTHAPVQTVLADMYDKCEDIHGAQSVFDGIRRGDVVTWTAMIRGYAKLGMMEDARRLFDEMGGRNAFCWTAMVGGYANIGGMDSARELYDKMEVKDRLTWGSMISGYGKIRDVVRARQVFHEVGVKDATGWAVMLCCYAQNGYANEALEIYGAMRKSGVSASEVAMVGVISACTQLVDVEMAKKLDKVVEGECCRRTIFMSNALIHMYSRCGNATQARKEFDSMELSIDSRPRGPWEAYEALDLFQEILAAGITPNQVTFVSVLSACSHTRLVEEELGYYHMMTEVLNFKPQTEHYLIMIDLSSKAGELERAYNILVGSDGMVHDAGVRSALLAARRVYGNLKLGEIVVRKLFMMYGNYMLLASIYASAGRWADAEKVRKARVLRGMARSPGRSMHMNM